MTSLNTLGIRIAGIILGIGVLLFILWKGALFIFSPDSIPSPTPTPLAALPQTTSTPEPTLNPELRQQLSAFTATEEKNIGTYTKKYIASLPPNATQAQVLDQTSLEQFVNANKGPLLPALPTGTVKTSTASGKTAIQKYLDSISPVQNTALQSVTGDMITSAFQKQESGQDAQALAPVRASIEKNFSLFTNIQAPQEAADLHVKLLQATQSLINNIALLQSMKQDFVGGLIGQKNIADLDAVFSDLATQISTLEKKYNLK